MQGRLLMLMRLEDTLQIYKELQIGRYLLIKLLS